MTDGSGTRERRSGRERRLLELRRRSTRGHVPERRALDDRRSGEDRRALIEEGEQLSLGRRLRQPRTILSLAIPLVLLVLIFRVFLNIDVNELLDGIGRSDKRLILAAFVIFYLGFPLRG
jgi:hypothetical protein